MTQTTLDWHRAPVTTRSGPMAGSAVGGGLRTMMNWGPMTQFRVYPLNFHELDHQTQTDWAHKEIAGAAVYREWVGENDETLHIRGRLFPYRVGGMTEIEIFEKQRRAGIANILIRGDGEYLGWFVCDQLVRNHTWISSQGIGQMINFEATMARVPVPQADTYYANLWKNVLP